MNPTGGRTPTIVLLVLSACQSAWTYPSFATLPLDSAALIEKTYAAGNHTRDLKYIDPRAVVIQHKVETDKVVNKVVGGTLATEGQFPWMVVVYQLQGGGSVTMCGGTILSARWVLTAGHCVAEGPKQFDVLFGVVDKRGISYDSYNGPGVFMRVTQGAVHPQFGDGINDIALLYMPQDIVFTPNIQPIKLAGRADMQETFAGNIGHLFGWGLDGTSNPDDQNYLKYTSLPIISNAECSQYWDINDGNICTAADTGHDACQGDSGGPLVVMTNGQPLQVGIVSYGDAGCPSQRPGVYTRVTTYVEWIDEITRIQY